MENEDLCAPCYDSVVPFLGEMDGQGVEGFEQMGTSFIDPSIMGRQEVGVQ